MSTSLHSAIQESEQRTGAIRIDDSMPPTQFSNPVLTTMDINSLPTEIVSMIARQLAIEHDVTKKDQTVQRRRNLRLLCRVSRRLYQGTVRDLYQVIHIPDTIRLRLFLKTIESQPGIAKFVHRLSVNLAMCWGRISENETRKLCEQLYRVLNATTRLQLLSLDLRECTNCFRNSGLESFAVNGSNGTAHALELHSFSTW